MYWAPTQWAPVLKVQNWAFIFMISGIYTLSNPPQILTGSYELKKSKVKLLYAPVPSTSS